MGLPKSRVPRLALIGGVLGALTAYGMQWFCNAFDYPINVGGRSLHAAPSWVPITFELGVLFSAFFIFFGSLGFFGLPRLYHPVFESDDFRRASGGTFWASVQTDGDKDHEERVSKRLRELGATHVSTVPDASTMEEEP
jgi:hypothetical protein